VVELKKEKRGWKRSQETKAKTLKRLEKSACERGGKVSKEGGNGSVDFLLEYKNRRKGDHGKGDTILLLEGGKTTGTEHQRKLQGKGN